MDRMLTGWSRTCHAAFVVVAALSRPPAPAVASEPTSHSAVLDLPCDGFLPGKLMPFPAAAGRPRTTLLWQSPLFEVPLEFAVDGIERIRFSKRRSGPPAVPAWRADLRGGDYVAGDIDSIDADHISMRIDGIGKGPLRIPRNAVERLSREGSAAKTIVPGGIDGWVTARGSWQEHGGRLACDKPGSTAYHDVAAPARAAFTLVLSWSERPDLDLLFAADKGDLSQLAVAAKEDYRVDLSAGDLLAIREGATAKFELAGNVPAGPGSLELEVFVDQEIGRMAVVLPGVKPDTRPVFDETVRPRKQAVRTGFGLRLRTGNARIESLRVSPWTAPEPRVVASIDIGKPGEVLESFDNKSFDDGTGAFVVRGAEGLRTVAAKDVMDIAFPAGESVAALPPPKGAVRVAFHGGTTLTGRILEVTQHGIRLDSAAAADPLECQISDLAVIDPVGGPSPAGLPSQPGILETNRARMLGCLANAAPPDQGIGWLPLGAEAPGSLVEHGEPMRIAYRGLAALGGVGIVFTKRSDAWVVAEVTPGGPAARDGRVGAGWKLQSIRLQENGKPVAASGLDPDEMRGLLGGVVGSKVRLQFTDIAGMEQEVVLVRDVGGRGDLAGAAEKDILDGALKMHESRSTPAPASIPGRATVYLKTGDSILGTVLSADPQGLLIKTDLAAEILVPAIAMRAVELLPAAAGSIPREKFARLLTLPRMQQADPPTHMLRMPSGDYLRGKLVALDGSAVRMSVLGTEKVFSRADVARLIWLSIEGDAAEEQALAAMTGDAARDGVPIRAAMTDGRRLTMTVERVVGDRLVGSNGIFGMVGVDLPGCNHIELFPSATRSQPGDLPYGQWKLKPAAAPRAVQKPGSDVAASPAPQPPGAENPLVGTRATLPTLPLLEPQADGPTRIGPGEWEGEVVVLVPFNAADAAGVESLPRLAAALEPFGADGVTVVAVGEGGSRDVVAKAVEGLTKRPAVAVDTAGVLQKIVGNLPLPACVIVDREGRVDAVMPAAASDVGTVRTRVAGVVERSRKAAAEFATLSAASRAARAGDRECLEPLGRLLEADSQTVRSRSGSLLRRLTGLTAAEMPFNPVAPASQRAEQARRWQQWLAAEGISANVAFPQPVVGDWPESRPIEGRTLVCRAREVVELDADGEEVFRLPTDGTWACDVLPNGHRLVGQHGGRTVIEYDAEGREVWAVRNLPGGPMSARRIANGNTLVALSDANIVAEFDGQAAMTWSVKIEGRPCDARRLPDGTTLVAAHRANRIVQINTRGEELWAVEMPDPQTAQRLRNGNTLVAMSIPGIVREIDPDGRTVWEKEGFKVPVDVQKLADGTTLVQEEGGDLVELDVLGTEVRRMYTGGTRFLRW